VYGSCSADLLGIAFSIGLDALFACGYESACCSVRAAWYAKLFLHLHLHLPIFIFIYIYIYIFIFISISIFILPTLSRTEWETDFSFSS
jgi:hypothetical protein